MRLRRAASVAVGVLLVCALAALGYAVLGSPAEEDSGSGTSAAQRPMIAPRTAEGTEIGYADSRIDNRPRQRIPQTSDGVAGEIAPPIPRGLAPRRTKEVLTNRRLAPGVWFERFEITDYRGQVRGHLLRINPATPGLRLDYAGRRYVASVAPLPALLGADAVAAVNGDFFDIDVTGAPLGVGRDQQRGGLHGVKEGWNAAIYLDRDHRWHIGPVSTLATIVQHPDWRVTSVNSPALRPNGIGVYTGKWGATRSYRVLSGAPGYLRTVVVRGGVVVANVPGPPGSRPVQGMVLVGHGRAAEQLRTLRMGSPLHVDVSFTEQPLVVLTGNTRILRAGRRVAIDDREMHPRTAVGIDKQTGQILILVIDGRQSFSRGYTMVELADLMKELGADDAINLDGGGSSTMVARPPGRALTIMNSPSDGRLRPIPNGLQVLYTPR